MLRGQARRRVVETERGADTCHPAQDLVYSDGDAGRGAVESGGHPARLVRGGVQCYLGTGHAARGVPVRMRVSCLCGSVVYNM